MNRLEKSEKKEFFVRVFFMIFGVAGGFFFFEIYDSFPDLKGILFLLAFIALIVLVYLAESNRYKSRFETMIEKVASDMRHFSDGKSVIEPNDKYSEQVNSIYQAVEGMRLNLKKRIRIQQAILELENILAANIELDTLVNVLLNRLVEETGSNWGVFYIYNKITDKLELKKSIGLSKNVYKEFDVEIGEGFIGTAAQKREMIIRKDIPRDTVFENRTFLGKVVPRTIMTVPVFDKEELMAVIAFASIFEYNDEQIEAIEMLRNYLGYAITNCQVYEKTQRLYKELQFQNELIQNMNDELEKKVNDRTDMLNGVINSIEDYMIVSVDRDGYIMTWNEGAEKIKGYTAEETIGHHITTVFLESEKDEIMGRFEMALKEGRFAEYGWRTRRDGTTFYADVVITPIFNKDGELQGYTNITKDITVTKNLEQALLCEKAYNDKLVESSTRALLFTNKDGVIISGNEISKNLLAPREIDIIGKPVGEFFIESGKVSKSIESICRSSGRGEYTGELLYKHDGITHVTISALCAEVTNSEQNENKGVLIYLTV